MNTKYCLTIFVLLLVTKQDLEGYSAKFLGSVKQIEIEDSDEAS